MSQNSITAIATVGIDIGKNSFHVVGLDQRGAIVLRQKWSRGQVDARFANMPPCLVGMEACVGAHHLSRKLKALGHDARLMPAKYVRPYSKGQKNDFRDAEAIAEAVQRPTMKFVATKTVDQLDLQALHRVRERLVSQRTGIVNQIGAPSCWSVALRCDRDNASCAPSCRASLPRLHPDVLSPAWCGSSRTCSWRLAPARRAGRGRSIAGRDQGGCCAPGCRLRAADERSRHRPDHLQCDGGRDRPRRGVLEGAGLPGAWLGLVPKQISTGDRTILGKISKRGNRYLLRVLFVQAAWVVINTPKSWEGPGLTPCIEAANKRLHPNVLAIALANKLARIAWGVLAHGRNFEARTNTNATAQAA